MSDFALTPTSELIAEIQNRSVASVILVIMQDDQDTCTTKGYYHGNDFTKLGLVEGAKYRLNRKIYGELETPDEDHD